MRHGLSRWGQRAADAWLWALTAAFIALCLRFEHAELTTPGVSLGAALALGAGAFAVGYRWPAAAPFAFAASVPLLGGLQQAGLLRMDAPLNHVFAALFLGWSARERFCFRRMWPDRGAPPALQTTRFLGDLLATAILISWARESAHFRGAPGLGSLLWGQAAPSYILHYAVLWLEGLFFFRWLCRDGAAPLWLKPLFLVYGATIVFFLAVQGILRLPMPYNFGAERVLLDSPFEDIHSFGGVVVTLFAYGLFSWPAGPGGASIGSAAALRRGGCVLAAFILVIYSWSRATWAAAVLIVLLFGLLRLSKRWLGLAGAIGFLAMLALSLYPPRMATDRNSYSYRLESLLRPENPLKKDPIRAALYRKAWAMIRQRPLTGSGIGSFYVRSVEFSRPDDPPGTTPNFAHDFLAQFAAELGLPATGALVAVIGLALYGGFAARRTAYGPASAPEERSRGLVAIGLAGALTAYLATEVTANAANIYPTNQFFFWFLVAALLRSAAPAAVGGFIAP